MLSWNGLAHLRPTYVSLCLNNMKLHNSVVMSLRLLRSLMDMSPQKRKKLTPGMGSGNIHEVQQTLDILETNDLLTLFFDDLDHFKNSARAALAQLGPSAANVDVKNTILVGKFPYMIQIKDRLAFLDHVLSTTHFTLSVPQVTTFWNDLVIGALVPEERDEAFGWLEHTRALLSQKPTQTPAEDPMFHLFLELVPSLQVDQLSKEGFTFFDFFYRYVNYKLHKITQAENNKYVITLPPPYFSLFAHSSSSLSSLFSLCHSNLLLKDFYCSSMGSSRASYPMANCLGSQGLAGGPPGHCPLESLSQERCNCPYAYSGCTPRSIHC